MTLYRSADGGGTSVVNGQSPWAGKRVHFIGIGGTGMRGAARMLLQQGCLVSGSDLHDSEWLRDLRAQGARIYVGHHASQLPARVDLVVITAAIPSDNPELRCAQARGTRVMKYAELVGELMLGHEGIAISGTHGKTTTTALTAWLLRRAGCDPSFVIGGEVPQLGGNAHLGAKCGKGNYFVVEACEYDRSFWHLHPKYAVITNVDRDHLDFYGNLESIVAAFAGFCRGMMPGGFLLVNGDDANALRAARSAPCPVTTYGWGAGLDWRVVDYCCDSSVGGARSRFWLEHGDERLGPFEIAFPGAHYAFDAAAAAIVCLGLGVVLETVTEGIASYRGTRRRFEEVGFVRGVRIIDDYGHHPTEIATTLAAARQKFPKNRIWCVFQPHQYSRTRLLLEEFARAFGVADRVIVPDIYSVRDSEADKEAVSSYDLVQRMRALGVTAEHISTLIAVVERLVEAVEPGDVVVTMGAGSVDQVGRHLLYRLRGGATEGASRECADCSPAA